ncbi:VanZ family protein [Zoogloea sp.]|uniref:VanZ family protein n=1 Tax=Zoogloea sp. TaxID=49181 RepID=UPI00261022DE|nr:VanZ family protein [Zoogloea sp.]MDD3352799.1 VanZ family protein [Zoogloea sp.]
MIPLAVVPTVVEFQDKLHHGAAFIVLTVLGGLAWRERPGTIAVGLLGYGVLIELCQATLTVNRVGEAQDVLADGLGIALGWLLMRNRGTRSAAQG